MSDEKKIAPDLTQFYKPLFEDRKSEAGYQLRKAELNTDTAYKAVDFNETYTGRAFWPLKPNTADVSIIDIAHHLSNQCRYSGAPKWLYSTAQHCCLLYDYVKNVVKGDALACLQILIHDAAEAYLVDMPRPIKQYMPEFRLWDHRIQMCVRSWAGIGDVPIPPWQDELDSRIIVDERAQVLSDSDNVWGHDLEPLGVIIEPWTPVRAEQEFLLRYAQCTHKIFGKHQYLRSAWGIPITSDYKPHDFKTGGSDVMQHGEQDTSILTDLMEVDFRGGVGRVAVRSPDGMMVRDTQAGKFPMPAWKWVRGNFDLSEPAYHMATLEGMRIA